VITRARPQAVPSGRSRRDRPDGGGGGRLPTPAVSGTATMAL